MSNDAHIPGITAEQWTTLMRPLNTSRVAKRSQGGKQLSYLEAYDVKAHLIRIFGFANFDSETISETLLGVREYVTSPKKNEPGKDMVEPYWHARHRLTIKDRCGEVLAVYTEGAVGSASGPANTLADLHDNALKTAASDALKRCAINLGTQFGLSLYDNGTTNEIVRRTLIAPDGVQQGERQQSSQQAQHKAERLQESVGAVRATDEPTNEGEVSTGNAPGGDDGSQGAAGEQN